MLKPRFLAASALASSILLVPAVAFAQQAPVAPAAPQGEVATETAAAAPESVATPESSDTVVVTGSRIRRPNLESGAPITTVSGAEFFETGSVSVGDVLNDLPQLRSSFSQQNSTVNLGTRGLNLLDLRGLGTARTLVLVNGRRHVGGDVLVNAVSPDTNTFPTDLIERVDVITGGGSSIYGSDAIAGVVNFVTKQDYEGFQVRGQGGISSRKDAGSKYLSVLAGTNFDEGRGNIAVNLEYARQDRYFGSGGRGLRQNDTFVVVDTDPAGAVNGSDGNPDRVFLRDIRSTTISTGGQLGFAQTAANPRCGRDVLGNPFTCAFLFQPDGTLARQTGTRVGIGPNGSFLGGNGYIGREGELLTLTPQIDRYAVNFIGHYEVSPAFVPFFEAKYVRSEAFGSQSGPFFSQGTTLGGDVRERIRLDNPYLSAQARSVIEGELRATGATPTDATRISLRRNWLDLGIRDEKIRRETYRAVVGVRGDFNDDWNYELTANYGEHREKNVILSNINTQRYLLAIDSVRNTAGNIVCRSQVTPASAGTDLAGDAANLAADVAACVPLNPFGDGTSTQAARDYLTVNSRATGKITQFVANGFVAGDLSSLFELPGGPVAFSLGGEYRRETVGYDLDDLTQAGYAFYNAIPTFSAPSFEVKEVFGEISIPLLKDVPFFRELTLSGSGRISDYKGSTGTVYAYGGELSWRPLEDIRFRGSYTRAVRAPNLSDLFSAQGQNFAPGFVDPCSARNVATGSATRAANCSAAGAPAGYDFVYAQSLEIVSGGNPNLNEETSDNYTVGGVLTPTFIPGLSLSVDYFDITVNNVITSASAQQIANSCYDAASLDNVFCSLFTRNGSGAGPRGEAAFQILEGSLLQSTLNFAKLKSRGIDTELAYRKRFGWGSAGLKAIWTHTIQRSNFTNPAEPNRENQILGELGDPKDQVNVNADVKVGPLTLGYQFRWIDKQVLNTYENINGLQGRAPENLDYADVNYYGNVFYHDFRLDAEVSDKFNLYVGVDNVTDRLPPFGLTGVGAGSGIYDVRGRYFYTGFVAKF